MAPRHVILPHWGPEQVLLLQFLNMFHFHIAPGLRPHQLQIRFFIFPTMQPLDEFQAPLRFSWSLLLVCGWSGPNSRLYLSTPKMWN
jgi:hypothetical protein